MPNSETKNNENKPIPLWLILPMDGLLLASCLLTFAYFHHVKPKPVAVDPDTVVTAYIPGLMTEGTVTGTTTSVVGGSQTGSDTSGVAAGTGASGEDVPQSGTSSSVQSTSAQTDANGQTVSTAQSTSGGAASSQTTASTTASSSASATVTTTAVTDPRDYIDWGSKFSAQFSAGNDIYQTENSYRSHDVCVNISTVPYLSSVAYVADIYMRYSGNFKGAYAVNKNGDFGRNIYEDGASIMQRNNAIVGINADMLGTRDTGMIVRNWELFRSEPLRSVGCLWYDGSFSTITKQDFNMTNALASGVYQTMTFDPALVQNGQAAPKWNGSVSTTQNPRSGFGYYEPGHYVFVVVDGRQPGYSDGLTGDEFTQFFLDLGVTEAFNLDGGDSARMYFNGQLVNSPSGARSLSDVFLIREVQ